MATTTDPFAASGGGVQTPDGSWIPKNHPQAKPYLNAPVPAAPGAPTNTVQGQAAASQAYNPTPTAAPTQNTTNAGTQDVVRNSYLQRATQGTDINMNDPVIRQQADAFAAGNERSRRNASADNAEAMNARMLGGSGAQGVVERSINETAAQRQGSFEADLARQELTYRRQEIADALERMAGMLTGDQTRALQMELAKLDAQLRREGIASGEKLGFAGLALDRDRMNMQNDQFGKTLGFNMADREAYYNQAAMLAQMGL